MADQVSKSTEENAAQDLLREAQVLLSQTGRKTAYLADFIERLFGHVIFEGSRTLRTAGYRRAGARGVVLSAHPQAGRSQDQA